jgi:Flp pilus assembly protein TadB
MMSVLWTLLIVWCVWRTVSAIRASRAAQHAWEEAQWDCEDGEALRQFAITRAEEERRAQWAAPIPCHIWLIASVFLTLCIWMLVDTWGTPRLWFSLTTSSIFVILLAVGVGRVWYRRRHLRATAQDDRTSPVAAARSQQSLSLYAPRH